MKHLLLRCIQPISRKLQGYGSLQSLRHKAQHHQQQHPIARYNRQHPAHLPARKHINNTRPRSIRQAGTALLSALLITALAAALAAEVATDQSWLLTEANWARGAERGQMALEYGKQVAIRELFQMLQKDPQHRIYQVPSKLQKLGVINGASLSMRLQDAETKWNINILSRDEGSPIGSLGMAETDAQRLLELITSKITFSDQSKTHALNPAAAWQEVQKIKNYLGPYQSDHDDRYYLKQKPAYYPAHQMMMHSSQMRAIDGVSRILYWQLASSVTALPTQLSLINVNDLTKADQFVGITLGINNSQLANWNTCRQGLGLIKSNIMLQQRLQETCPELYNPTGGYSGTSEDSLSSRIASDDMVVNQDQNRKTQLTTHTNYIFVTIQAKIGIQTLFMQSLFFVGKAMDDRLVVQEIWQTPNLSNS